MNNRIDQLGGKKGKNEVVNVRYNNLILVIHGEKLFFDAIHSHGDQVINVLKDALKALALQHQVTTEY